MRLYQLGLDEEMWKHGRRPNLAVYQELAFRRPSVEKATNWKANEDKIAIVPKNKSNGDPSGVGPNENNEHNQLDAAAVGLGAIFVVAGIYVCRKLIWKK